jgi:YD repeat-containing protein
MLQGHSLVAELAVEVMAPDFSLFTHTFNYRGDLLDYRFRLVSDGSYRVVFYAYGYDEEGNRTQTVLPDGGEELRNYAIADPDPRMRGRLLKRELRARAGFPSPSRIVLRAEYEPRFQLLKKLRDERGAETVYIYDLDTSSGPGAAGKLERIELPPATLPDGTIQNAAITMTVDSRGRLERLVSPTGAIQTYEYGAAGDARGLPVRTIRDVGGIAATEELSYDAFGNIRATTDALGATTDLVHDALGRLGEVAMPDIDGLRGVARLDYDDQGQIVALWRPRGAYDDATLSGSPIADRIERNVLGHVRTIIFGANTEHPVQQTQATDYRGLVVCARDPEGMRIK